jgi:hypothetical protein
MSLPNFSVVSRRTLGYYNIGWSLLIETLRLIWGQGRARAQRRSRGSQSVWASTAAAENKLSTTYGILYKDGMKSRVKQGSSLGSARCQDSVCKCM